MLNVLTGQRKDVTELKFLWSVNATGASQNYFESCSHYLHTRTISGTVSRI